MKKLQSQLDYANHLNDMVDQMLTFDGDVARMNLDIVKSIKLTVENNIEQCVSDEAKKIWIEVSKKLQQVMDKANGQHHD